MRRPTLSETCAMVLFWALILRKIFRAFETASFDTDILVWGILALVWTYRLLNAEAYARMKKNSASHDAYMAQRFGRWRLLVECSPLLFLAVMCLAAFFLRERAIEWTIALIFIGLVGLIIGSIWVACLGPKDTAE